VDLGRVTSIEKDHKPMDKATKGQEVCIKIEPCGGDAPKLLGRHFEITDTLVSKVGFLNLFFGECILFLFLINWIHQMRTSARANSDFLYSLFKRYPENLSTHVRIISGLT